MNRREVRGFNIAVDDRIVKVNDNQWRVKGDAGKIYTVIFFDPEWRCECINHYRHNYHECKHIKAIRFSEMKEGERK